MIHSIIRRLRVVPRNSFQPGILASIYRETLDNFGYPPKRILTELLNSAARGKKIQDMLFYFKLMKIHGKLRTSDINQRKKAMSILRPITTPSFLD